MTRTKLDPELLITLIENSPVLWDKTWETYRDKNLRAAAWREVCNNLNEDFQAMEEKERQKYTEIVVKKWNQIRDSWMRSLNAKKNTKKSGSTAVKAKKYCYHNQMMFLKKIISPAVTYDSTNNISKETCDMNQDNADIEVLKPAIDQNKQSEHNPSIVNESPGQDTLRVGKAKRFKKDVPKHRRSAMDQKIMSFIDYRLKNQQNSQNENRNMFFFKSLLPTLVTLSDDQVLRFQAGVINLLQNIKKYSNPPSQGYFTPQYQVSSPRSTQSSSQIDSFQSSPAGSTCSDTLE